MKTNVKCKKHPKYKAIMKPRSKCSTCIKMWNTRASAKKSPEVDLNDLPRQLKAATKVINEQYAILNRYGKELNKQYDAVSYAHFSANEATYDEADFANLENAWDDMNTVLYEMNNLLDELTQAARGLQLTY